MTASRFLTLAFLLIVSALAFAADHAADSPFDIVITNGHIVDRTGSPWYSGDIGIRDSRIAATGNLSAAARNRPADAKGKVAAPGLGEMLAPTEAPTLAHQRLPP